MARPRKPTAEEDLSKALQDMHLQDMDQSDDYVYVIIYCSSSPHER